MLGILKRKVMMIRRSRFPSRKREGAYDSIAMLLQPVQEVQDVEMATTTEDSCNARQFR